jgi:hypothetical protein
MVVDSIHRTDRDRLLESLVRSLETDERVRAAWLAGSLGRGNADDLSDIDLWLAVRDDLMAGVIADPVAWVRARCDAQLAFSIPHNAAPGGAYAFSLVRRPHGLQQVDWYWAPATLAERPRETALLFERDPIPVAGVQPALDDRECQDLTLFWCQESLGMAHIAIKGIRRGNCWTIARHLQLVADCVGNARWTQRHRRAPLHDDPRDVTLPDVVPTDRSDQARLLLDLLELLDPALVGLPDRDRAGLVATLETIREATNRIPNPDAG